MKKYVLYSAPDRGFLTNFAPKRTESGAKIIACVSPVIDLSKVISCDSSEEINVLVRSAAKMFGQSVRDKPFCDMTVMAFDTVEQDQLFPCNAEA